MESLGSTGSLADRSWPIRALVTMFSGYNVFCFAVKLSCEHTRQTGDSPSAQP